MSRFSSVRAIPLSIYFIFVLVLKNNSKNQYLLNWIGDNSLRRQRQENPSSFKKEKPKKNHTHANKKKSFLAMTSQNRTFQHNHTLIYTPYTDLGFSSNPFLAELLSNGKNFQVSNTGLKKNQIKNQKLTPITPDCSSPSPSHKYS